MDKKSVKGKRKIRFTIQWKMVLIGLAVVAAFLGLILGIILPGLQSSLIAEKRTETKQYVQAAYSKPDSKVYVQIRAKSMEATVVK